jgi:hypothetical protein
VTSSPTSRYDLPLALVRTPIQTASVDLITACVYAATEDTQPGYGDWLLPGVLASSEADAPRDLIADEHGPAGWVGLTQYNKQPLVWESTTFLAPRLRGIGLLPYARCWQAHMVDDLLARHGDEVRVLTSIAEWNHRSQQASRRYASDHGWPDTWRHEPEPHKDRIGVLFDWPVPVPHTCFRIDRS